MHKHHILPRHMGGTDDPSNIVEVTVEQHAELHFALYLEHGLMGDWLACHMLSGQITAQEATRQAQIHANRTRVWSEESRKKISDANKARGINYFERRVFTPEYRKKLSDAAKARKGRPISEKTKRKLSEAGRKGGAAGKGKSRPFSPEHREKLRQAALKREELKRQQKDV